LRHDNAGQFEGGDHGGRDSAGGLALAGTIDVQASDSSCNRLMLGPTPSDTKIMLGTFNQSVNGFVPT